MSLVLSSDRQSQQLTTGLASLTKARRALAEGNLALAARLLKDFRTSSVGNTACQVESDLLEVRLQAFQDPTELIERCTKLLPRHVGRNTEDRFILGASDLIRRYVSPAAATVWVEQAGDPKRLFDCGRGRSAATYLQLLRETGRLDEARAFADGCLNGKCSKNPHPELWKQTIMTLRGQRPGEASNLPERIYTLGKQLSLPQRLRLWRIAADHHILVASTTDMVPTVSDSATATLAAYNLSVSQATLYLRQQDYAEVASNLQRAHDYSVQIHGGETLRSLEFSLQQFEALLLANQAKPTDSAWLRALRSIATQLNQSPYLEHRLANIMRKAGYHDLALAQYAYVSSQYPQDQNGIRSACQLAVDSEDSGVLNDAQSRYLAIAGNPATTLSVASLCLIGAYRCAVRQNNQDIQSQVIQSLQSLNAAGSTLHDVLSIVKQLRDDGLVGMADALLNQGLQQYQSLISSGNLQTRVYLTATHTIVRRLYEARRFDDVVDVVNGIEASLWNNGTIAWGHLAGCLHYACLSWLALYNPSQALVVAALGAGPLNTRASQSAHVNLAVAKANEEGSGWAAATLIYNQIIALAPFSTAAMKARLCLARRAWQAGKVDEARQLAAGVLLDGKLNRKDPNLAETYWAAYGIAASKQSPSTNDDTLVYPQLSSREAMRRGRATRIARIFKFG